ncbi:MAG: AlkA N-terminal domain-containing protein [Lacrimispora sp.]|uniref:DNA-3-methyladenine glycosylase 2 family protein n=1 Tax=Lacrimispora sp. TaxID=2719234 RepID=UPI0039E5B2CA
MKEVYYYVKMTLRKQSLKKRVTSMFITGENKEMKNDVGLYAAFKAKDVRFDGRFFMGVSSTGIYCRPVCGARMPKAENCTFYSSAAEAEHAGYRPCLVCRPELAPGVSITDASSVLAQRAARMLEEHCGNGEKMEVLAGQLGCTGRHLRRVFMAEYHVTPIQYLQTCRLLLAKKLLTDTNLPVIDVAMASGFGGLRRFNDSFKEHYHLTPTDLRKKMSKEKRQSDNITVYLGYRPPYRWNEILRFLENRSIPGVDFVRDNMYFRTVHIVSSKKEDIYGWVRISHILEKNVLGVTIGETLLPVLPQVLGKIRNMFDLYCEPETIYQALSTMNDIRPGLCLPGTRLPGCFDPFEMSVRAILGQQITVKAASTLAGRIVMAFGTPVQTGIDGLFRAFPTPENIAALEGPIENHLGPLGVIASRAKTIAALAKAFIQEEINFGFCPEPEEEMKKLLLIPGIGNWTAQYIAMRTMAWPDAFLETDVGIKNALPGYTPKELLNIAEQWRPWRSYATLNLWNSL